MVIRVKKKPEKVTADTPLTPAEQKFAIEYVKTNSAVEAMKRAGIPGKRWSRVLNRPNVQAEIKKIMEDIRKQGVADANEVMEYFTSVMRGEVKDQFGLDAPLSERTRAAQELAKRTVDIENRKAGVADQITCVTLNWDRQE